MSTFLQAPNQKALILVVEGLGHMFGANIVADTFSTHPLTDLMKASLATSLGLTGVASNISNNVVIQNYPMVSSVRMDILDTISSDAGWTMTLTAGQNQEVRNLLDYERGSFAEVDYTGQPILVTASVTATATAIFVNNQTNLTFLDYIIVDKEAMQITSKAGTTVLNVTRGVLGTTPVVHNSYPVVVWSQLPSITGSNIKLYEIELGDTVLPSEPIYRGRIDSITTNESGSLNLSVSSLWSQVFATKLVSKINTVRRGVTYDDVIDVESNGEIIYSPVTIDWYNYFSGMDSLIMWIGDTKKWILINASWDTPIARRDPISDVDRSEYKVIFSDIRAWGEEGGLITEGQPPNGFITELSKVTYSYPIILSHAEDMTIGGVVEGLLTGEFPSERLNPGFGDKAPPGSYAGLEIGDIGDLSPLNVIPYSTSNLGLVLFLAPSRTETLGDYISEQLLKPAGLGLSIGSDGKVYGIDWSLTFQTSITITTEDLASDSYISQIEQDQSLLSVNFEAENLLIKSRVSEVYYRGAGIEVEVKPGTLSNLGLMEDRWRFKLIATFEIAPRIVTLSLRSSKSPIVGSMVGVDLPRLPLPSGYVDQASSPPIVRLGRILEVSRDLNRGEKTVKIAFGKFVQENEGAVWSPSAEVNFNQAAGTSIILVHSNNFAQTAEYVLYDVDAFSNEKAAVGGNYNLQLLDQYLTPRSDNNPLLSLVPDSTHIQMSEPFKSGGVNIAINDKDVIVASLYTDQIGGITDAKATWWADSTGRLSGDAGRLYE